MKDSFQLIVADLRKGKDFRPLFFLCLISIFREFSKRGAEARDFGRAKNKNQQT